MAVSKRLRYEILRRDGHACRYCGRAAPDVPLTVDHVLPTALGGTDDPTNLVTACKDCNAGKSSVAPDSTIVADVSQDAIRWAKAAKEASAIMESAARQRLELLDSVSRYWTNYVLDYGGNICPRPDDWPKTIYGFTSRGLPVASIVEALEATATADRVRPDARWRYFCGICWRMLRNLEDMTRALIAADEGGE